MGSDVIWLKECWSNLSKGFVGFRSTTLNEEWEQLRNVETYVFLRNRIDDKILSETHEMTMCRKRVMMTMTSTKMKWCRKIMIKKARSLLVDANQNMAFQGAICYIIFFDLTISENY